jgi:hypothetical protein
MDINAELAQSIARTAAADRADIKTAVQRPKRDDGRYLAETEMYRSPAQWPEHVAAVALRFVQRRIRYLFSSEAATRDVGPEGIDEITAATLFRIVSGADIPGGQTIRRWLARACRYAQLTNGYDTGLQRNEPRGPRDHLALEEALRGPYRGCSVDARQADPARAAAAAEEVTRNGCTVSRPWHVRHRRKSVKTRRHYVYQIIRGQTIYRHVRILGHITGPRIPIATQITIERIPTSSKRYQGDRHHNPRSRYVSRYRPAPILHGVGEPAGELAQAINTLRETLWSLRRRHTRYVERVSIARDRWTAWPTTRHVNHTDITWLSWRSLVATAAAGMPAERYRHVPDPMPQPIPSAEPRQSIVSVDARRGWIVTADENAYTPELRYPGSRVTDATPEQLEQRQREWLDRLQ